MARKITNSGKIGTPSRKPVTGTVKTAVRNSPIPKPVTAAPKRMEITPDQVARRAFEIFAAGNGGSELDHWFQAERELRVAA